jgi:hypothetical protein
VFLFYANIYIDARYDHKNINVVFDYIYVGMSLLLCRYVCIGIYCQLSTYLSSPVSHDIPRGDLTT